MIDVDNPTLAELAIVACSEAFRDDGEILVTGIGTVPRLGAGLAKLTHAPQILMTDSEAYLVEEPVPLGPRGDYQPKHAGYMPFSRVFDVLESGARHAMITPVQVDRLGQANISVIGDYDRPKVQMLGARGLPGNSINHANSMFVPRHSKRAFVEGEVDMISSVGTDRSRWPAGTRGDYAVLGVIVTDLCVMDFNGPERSLRVVSLHPGVSFEQVQQATSFELAAADSIGETPLPTAEQLQVIDWLDPHGLRAGVFKDNPRARPAEGAA